MITGTGGSVEHLRVLTTSPNVTQRLNVARKGWGAPHIISNTSANRGGA